MADDPNRIDPRYDPAFQRGYQGEVRAPVRSESALRRSPRTETPPERMVAPPPAAPQVADEPAAVPVPTAAEPVGSAATPAHPTAPGEQVVTEAPASTRDVTRNPFYLAAAALAVLLIVGGAVWLNQGFAAIADRRDASDVGYFAAFTMSFGAPLLIGIGVLIVAGLLFVLARGWRPRDGD